MPLIKYPFDLRIKIVWAKVQGTLTLGIKNTNIKFWGILALLAAQIRNFDNRFRWDLKKN